jgi:hypothetical protein
MQARPDFSKLYSAFKYARTFLVRSVSLHPADWMLVAHILRSCSKPPNDRMGHLDAILLGRKGVKVRLGAICVG